MRCLNDGKRTVLTMVCAMPYIALHETQDTRSCGKGRDFLLRPSQGGRGGRGDTGIIKPAPGHTLVGVVIVDLTRVDFVASATFIP